MTLTYKNRRITRPFRLARFGDDGENLWHMQLPETVTACL